MPRKVRGLATGTVLAAFSVGQVTAALLGLLVVPTLGWRALFFIGVIPGILIWFTRRSVPESVRYLLSKGRSTEAERVVEQIERENGARADVSSLPPSTVQAANTLKRSNRFTLAGIFSFELRGRTSLLWIVSIGLFWAGNGLIFMLPLILTQRGLSISNALSFSLIQASFGILGYMSISYLMEFERFGRRIIL